MSSPPVVSVVVPTYHRPEFVRRAVRSVLAQGVSVEVIVVDDHSPEPYLPDPTAEMPIRVLRQPQCLGVAAARNRGIAAARGTYVAFLDDDDIWLEGKLQRQLDRMSAEGRRWSYTGISHVDANLDELFPFRPTQGAPPAFEIDNAVGSPSTVIVERELLWASGGFSSSLSVLADWELWIRLAQAGPPAVVDEPLVQYVIHAQAMHLTQIRESLRERRLLGQRLGRSFRFGGIQFWMWTARSLRETGRVPAAVAVALYAAVRFPRGFARELAGHRSIAHRGRARAARP